MQTYPATKFNHGAALVNIFSWGLGGDAQKTMDSRVVTEGPEALKVYRRFLKGAPLRELPTTGTTSYLIRLPARLHRIQHLLPEWVQKTGRRADVEPLMHPLEAALKAKEFAEAELVADSILKLIATRPQ